VHKCGMASALVEWIVVIDFQSHSQVINFFFTSLRVFHSTHTQQCVCVCVCVKSKFRNKRKINP